jgi:multiple antibiotic resistance protein
MLAVLVTVFIQMICASWIYRLIGNSGVSIISRVVGLIIVSVATANVLSGIKEYFLL